MRYTFYFDENNHVEAGFYYEDGVVRMKDVIETPYPASRMIFCDEKDIEFLNGIYHAIEKGEISAEKKRVRLAPLILNERANVFCVGRNYKNIGEEMNRVTGNAVQTLERPAFFYKPNRTVIASGDQIVACCDDTRQLDYEGEVGVVIGKKGKDISMEEARSYLYGYTICNDVSARDAMKAYYQMYKGKTMDTFSPIGPCIVTAEEIPNFRAMELETSVNYELRQKGNTSDLLFDFPTVIHHLSKSMTLLPGDIIMTGTPAGIGAAMHPPRFLKDEDLIEISVKGIGTLENVVSTYFR